ncbi:hypothetical protein ACJIZ3_008281 [Penstemon smallii]|uniref:PGG domain-containing protein n=1 Tax=Penstemon smallii TaxID=265156 RepID=A0ABD3TAI3_9LAMI
MENKLLHAAKSGNVQALVDLIREDSTVLEKWQLWGCTDTPLHLACLLGHLQFVKEYLNRLISTSLGARQLCQLNQDGYTPLHLASANGHVDVIEFLLDEFAKQNPSAVEELCMKKGRDGMTALHSAIVSGSKIDVINVLLTGCPNAANEVTDYAETVLHLAVKHMNRYETFKFLIDKIKPSSDLLNSPDLQGNTIVQCLVKQSGIDMNKENSYGLTPLDIIFVCSFSSNDIYIQKVIQTAGGLSSDKKNASPINPNVQSTALPLSIPRSPPPPPPSPGGNRDEPPMELHQDMTNGMIIMASLIATFALQVALTSPGGYWQDSTEEHRPGKSILYDLARKRFTRLMAVNAVTFLSSVSLILLMIQPLVILRRVWFQVRLNVYLLVVLVTTEFFMILCITTEGKMLLQRSFLLAIGCCIIGLVTLFFRGIIIDQIWPNTM